MLRSIAFYVEKGPIPDLLRRVQPFTPDVVAAPLGVLSDALPCRRLAAVRVLERVVVDHAEAVGPGEPIKR